MTKTKFLRRIWRRHSKLGRNRKKKQIWRKPTGRDNKMREKRKGHPKVVSIGYRKKINSRGKINEKSPVMVMNLNDLRNVKENQIVLMGNIGRKKKIEIAMAAKEKKIKVYNMNPEQFLKKLNKNQKKKRRN